MTPDREVIKTGSMSVGRRGQTSTLLADGHVLVSGGASESVGGDGRPLSSAELYDPVAGTFGTAGTMTSAAFTTPRLCFRTAAC